MKNRFIIILYVFFIILTFITSGCKIKRYPISGGVYMIHTDTTKAVRYNNFGTIKILPVEENISNKEKIKSQKFKHVIQPIITYNRTVLYSEINKSGLFQIDTSNADKADYKLKFRINSFKFTQKEGVLKTTLFIYSAIMTPIIIGIPLMVYTQRLPNRCVIKANYDVYLEKNEIIIWHENIRFRKHKGVKSCYKLDKRLTKKQLLTKDFWRIEKDPRNIKIDKEMTKSIRHMLSRMNAFLNKKDL